MSRKILPVIMCGGAGTRVWPESRETMPKQFIPLIGKSSTFQDAVRRVSDPIFDTPIVVTNRDYRFLVREQLDEIGAQAMIVIEPSRRDSGPAVAVAAELAAKRDPATIVAVFAADHVILDQSEFLLTCAAAAAAAADGYIVTLGVTPSEPAVGYGYIRPGAAIASGKAREVEAFVEKPDLATAERYVAQGYLWNSGNFFFRADAMLDELRAFEPDMAEATARSLAEAVDDLGFLALDAQAFADSPKKSIDYAVMERTKRAAVVPADIGWSDVGNWDAVWKLSQRDESGNSIHGEGVALDSKNVHIRSNGLLTAVVGVSDVVVVSTQDAVLVLARDQGDKVKQLVDALKKEQRPRGDRAQAHLPPLGLLSVDRLRPALSGQAHRGLARTPAFAAKAFSSRRTLGRRQRHGGSDARRRGEDRARKRVDLPADRRRSPARQSRQDQPRAHRGANRLLSRRRRHRAARGRLQPAAELMARRRAP